MLRLISAFLFILCLSQAWAVEPEEQLRDPALEARARALGRELRCLVCENETVDASAAPLAADLRKLVRARILAGASDDEIRRMLSDRYGEYVLFRPRFDARTWLLWLGPFGLLLLAGGLALVRLRNSEPSHGATLTAQEEAEVEALLAEVPKSVDERARLTKN